MGRCSRAHPISVTERFKRKHVRNISTTALSTPNFVAGTQEPFASHWRRFHPFPSQRSPSRQATWSFPASTSRFFASSLSNSKTSSIFIFLLEILRATNWSFLPAPMDVGFFHGHFASGDTPPSITALFQPLRSQLLHVFLVGTYHVTRASIFHLTVSHRPPDVFNGAVSKLSSQASHHLRDDGVSCTTFTKQMSLDRICYTILRIGSAAFLAVPSLEASFLPAEFGMAILSQTGVLCEEALSHVVELDARALRSTMQLLVAVDDILATLLLPQFILPDVALLAIRLHHPVSWRYLLRIYARSSATVSNCSPRCLQG